MQPENEADYEAVTDSGLDNEADKVPHHPTSETIIPEGTDYHPDATCHMNHDNKAEYEAVKDSGLNKQADKLPHHSTAVGKRCQYLRVEPTKLCSPHFAVNFHFFDPKSFQYQKIKFESTSISRFDCLMCEQERCL